MLFWLAQPQGTYSELYTATRSLWLIHSGFSDALRPSKQQSYVSNLDLETTWYREIQREEQKAVKQCKEAAKRGDASSAKVIAKELVHTRKTISQLYTNKAHMIAMNAQLTEQLGVVKVAGTLSKSTQVLANPIHCRAFLYLQRCIPKRL